MSRRSVDAAHPRIRPHRGRGHGLSGLIAYATEADVAIHTLEVSVAGETVAREGVAPFGVDVPHRLYSVSKSITGLAVLMLAHEGRLRLDARIVDYFPEMSPVHPWLAETSIDDMLAMTGPHSRTTYDPASDGWLESYFRVVPTHRPGTVFTYDTSASYVLASLVERLTGEALLEFLRPRLLDPLGIGAGARFRTGPEGHSHGGSGLVAAPGDLLRIAEVLNRRGAWRGAQVIPGAVADGLLEWRSDPGTQTWGAPLRAGYGRQVWLPDEESWLMFGLGGQLVYGHPERDLAAVMTADTTMLASGDQRLLEAFLLALDSSDAGAGIHLAAPTPEHDDANATALRGSYSQITGENAPHLLEVDVDAEGGVLRWGLGEGVTFCVLQPLVAASSLGDAVITAGWFAPGRLDVRITAAADDIASVRMRIVVSDDGVLTVMSQGFGPEIHPAWTWRGSYRR
ncbi:serine hydrolase [Microbacterium sp. Marseille-Q6648]|uniref:serine hydrolase domain-containing protein n=1 Tax=Microbacterium sp. Marseille-Q6648 TaxID=2937991 RepID=UPI00203BCC8A|nr:serine hydrolase [Microbacterium sp. Marseille-Q6648]